MRVAVTAFFLGAAAVGALVLGAALVYVVLADASGRDALRVGLGGVDVISFERDQDGSATSFGPGLPLLALLGGLVNSVAAVLLQIRGRTAP